MKRVVYEPRALLELEHEWRWYERRAPGEGERLLALIEGVIRSIAQSPERFPVDRWHPRARRALVPKQRFPFSIVFTVRDDDVIYIVAVAHTKRRPGYWLRRLPRTAP